MRRSPVPATLAPGSLVVMEPPAGDGGSGMGELRNRIYEAVARHEPLSAVLGELTEGGQQALPGVWLVVFQLTDGVLRAHVSSPAHRRLLAALDGLDPHGPNPAPWWHLRGQTELLRGDDGWAPFRGAAEAEGLDRCWSDLLVTAAGEVVGTLTLFCAQDGSDVAGQGRKLDELKQLAALALEQHHLMEELYFLAQRDPLTSLWNRAQLDRLLGQALNESRSALSVVWLKLSGFGRVNSILGSVIGDEVLREAAGRLRILTRAGDTLARVGGDEFGVVLSGVSHLSEAMGAAERLRAGLARQYEIQGHSIQLEASAGVSLTESPEDEADLILRHARMAMESAHLRAPGSLASFAPAMHNQGRDRMELERLLRLAMPRGELILHYQPQFCVRSGRLAGCEALARWRQPDIGLVSPATFIPVAEELGLIADLGEWAMEEACRQAKFWLNGGQAVRVGVNVSPLQFETGRLVGQVEAMLIAADLPPELLELEITESAVLNNLDSVVDQMRQIHQLGVAFALDDFGSGQSSLSWLRELPVQRIKIDRRFVQELDSGPRTPILQNIIALAHDLQLSVIIEGIETEEQFERILTLGCDELQGFLRGRPMEPTRFENLYLHSRA